MKVQFDVSGRYNDDELTDQLVEMPAAPRAQDTIQFEEDSTDYEVVHVIWTPNHPDYDAYVVLR